ncbi:MAG: alpha/beta hydrolase [Bdellovibrionota bacterium]
MSKKIPTLTGLGLLLIASACSDKIAQHNPIDSRVQESPERLANAQMRDVLDKLVSLDARAIETLTPAEARLQPTPADAATAVAQDKNIVIDKKYNLKSVKDLSISGAAGKIPARFYMPNQSGTLPIVLYFHGGGFVLASKDVYDAAPRRIAQELGAIVISVDYRLAPEHKFPAAHDDAYAAYLWVIKNATSFNGDATKIAVAGESAGANLAINVSIRARNEGKQMPLHQLLVYPVAGNDLNTRSYLQFMNAKPLNRATMAWFFKYTLKTPEQASDSRLNLIAADLRDLPPTTLITAEIDPLNSEGRKLGSQLAAAGNSVKWRDYKGVTHEFFGMAAVIDEAKDAQDWSIERIKADLF